MDKFHYNIDCLSVDDVYRYSKHHTTPTHSSSSFSAVLTKCPELNSESIDSTKKYSRTSPNTNYQKSRCERKIMVTMRMNRDDQLNKNTKYLILDEVYDQIRQNRAKLMSPYLIEISRGEPVVMYPLQFTKEIIKCEKCNRTTTETTFESKKENTNKNSCKDSIDLSITASKMNENEEKNKLKNPVKSLSEKEKPNIYFSSKIPRKIEQESQGNFLRKINDKDQVLFLNHPNDEDYEEDFLENKNLQVKRNIHKRNKLSQNKNNDENKIYDHIQFIKNSRNVKILDKLRLQQRKLQQDIRNTVSSMFIIDNKFSKNLNNSKNSTDINQNKNKQKIIKDNKIAAGPNMKMDCNCACNQKGDKSNKKFLFGCNCDCNDNRNNEVSKNDEVNNKSLRTEKKHLKLVMFSDSKSNTFMKNETKNDSQIMPETNKNAYKNLRKNQRKSLFNENKSNKLSNINQPIQQQNMKNNFNIKHPESKLNDRSGNVLKNKMSGDEAKNRKILYSNNLNYHSKSNSNYRPLVRTDHDSNIDIKNKAENHKNQRYPLSINSKPGINTLETDEYLTQLEKDKIYADTYGEQNLNSNVEYPDSLYFSGNKIARALSSNDGGIKEQISFNLNNQESLQEDYEYNDDFNVNTGVNKNNDNDNDESIEEYRMPSKFNKYDCDDSGGHSKCNKNSKLHFDLKSNNANNFNKIGKETTGQRQYSQQKINQYRQKIKEKMKKKSKIYKNMKSGENVKNVDIDEDDDGNRVENDNALDVDDDYDEDNDDLFEIDNKYSTDHKFEQNTDRKMMEKNANPFYKINSGSQITNNNKKQKNHYFSYNDNEKFDNGNYLMMHKERKYNDVGVRSKYNDNDDDDGIGFKNNLDNKRIFKEKIPFDSKTLSHSKKSKNQNSYEGYRQQEQKYSHFNDKMNHENNYDDIRNDYEENDDNEVYDVSDDNDSDGGYGEDGSSVADDRINFRKINSMIPSILEKDEVYENDIDENNDGDNTDSNQNENIKVASFPAVPANNPPLYGVPFYKSYEFHPSNYDKAKNILVPSSLNDMKKIYKLHSKDSKLLDDEFENKLDFMVTPSTDDIESQTQNDVDKDINDFIKSIKWPEYMNFEPFNIYDDKQINIPEKISIMKYLTMQPSIPEKELEKELDVINDVRETYTDFSTNINRLPLPILKTRSFRKIRHGNRIRRQSNDSGKKKNIKRIHHHKNDRRIKRSYNDEVDISDLEENYDENYLIENNIDNFINDDERNSRDFDEYYLDIDDEKALNENGKIKTGINNVQNENERSISDIWYSVFNISAPLQFLTTRVRIFRKKDNAWWRIAPVVTLTSLSGIFANANLSVILSSHVEIYDLDKPLYLNKHKLLIPANNTNNKIDQIIAVADDKMNFNKMTKNNEKLVKDEICKFASESSTFSFDSLRKYDKINDIYDDYILMDHNFKKSRNHKRQHHNEIFKISDLGYFPHDLNILEHCPNDNNRLCLNVLNDKVPEYQVKIQIPFRQNSIIPKNYYKVRITNIIVDATLNGAFHLTVNAINEGFFEEEFSIIVEKCPVACGAKNVVNRKMLPYIGDNIEYLLPLQENNPNSKYICEVHIRNMANTVIARRQMIIKPFSRCLCVWYCSCDCIDDYVSVSTYHICRKLPADKEQQAGFENEHDPKFDYLELIALALYLVLFMLFLGLMKASFGCFFESIDKWKYDYIQPMLQYEYASRSHRFFINTLFFIVIPFIGCCYWFLPNEEDAFISKIEWRCDVLQEESEKTNSDYNSDHDDDDSDDEETLLVQKVKKILPRNEKTQNRDSNSRISRINVDDDNDDNDDKKISSHSNHQDFNTNDIKTYSIRNRRMKSGGCNGGGVCGAGIEYFPILHTAGTNVEKKYEENTVCHTEHCIDIIYNDEQEMEQEKKDTNYVIETLAKSRESLKKITYDHISEEISSNTVNDPRYKKACNLVDKLSKAKIVYRKLNQPIGNVKVFPGKNYSIRGYFLPATGPGYQFITHIPLRQYYKLNITGKTIHPIIPPIMLFSKDFIKNYANKMEVLESGDLYVSPPISAPCINVFVQNCTMYCRSDVDDYDTSDTNADINIISNSGNNGCDIQNYNHNVNDDSSGVTSFNDKSTTKITINDDDAAKMNDSCTDCNDKKEDDLKGGNSHIHD